MLAHESSGTNRSRGMSILFHSTLSPLTLFFQMMKVMKHVADCQSFRVDDDSVIQEIAQDAEGNLRKALLVFEALKMQT